MATKPTREQDRACDHLARALNLIAEAARLDGRGGLDRPAFASVALAIGRASSAFPLDAIVDRAVEARGSGLGLRSGTAELLRLVLEESSPLDALLLDDDGFRDLVARAEAELGDV